MASSCIGRDLCVLPSAAKDCWHRSPREVDIWRSAGWTVEREEYGACMAKSVKQGLVRGSTISLPRNNDVGRIKTKQKDGR